MKEKPYAAKSFGGAISKFAKDSRTKTYRKNFVANAILPNKIFERVGPYAKATILDFGCGKDAYWVKKFRIETAVHCDGFDLDCDSKVAPRLEHYSIVFASNVLNVQETEEQLEETLKQIVSFCSDRGNFEWNYPDNPRKLNIANKGMVERIKDVIWQMGYDCHTYQTEGKNCFCTIVKKY